MKSSPLLSAALVLSLAAPLWVMESQAAELAVESRIVEVTVFPNRAEVVREADVEIPPGKSVVALQGLPASLFPQSVRVRVGAEQDLRIGSVETRQVFAQETVQADERRLRREIEGLQDQRRGLDDRVAASRVQLDFIKSLGRETPKTVGEEISRGKLEPETWQQAWSLIGDGANQALDRIRAAELEQRVIDREIQQKQNELAQIGTGRRASVTARVQVEAEAAASLRLALSYQVPGASWRPLYDARLDSSGAALGLTQVGEVRQRTGEDWGDVQLVLSTARPASDARMPDLETWFLDFHDPRARREASVATLQESRIAQEADSGLRFLSKGGGPDLAAPEPVAEVVVSEFAASYRIAGLATVTADNAARKFVIAEHELPVTFAAQAVPKIAPVAYLFAEIAHPGEEPWLPGPVSVFRDGGFIGTSYLALLRPGEKRKLSFGVDDKIKVTHRLLEGERSREGLIEKSRRVERRYLMEISNLHKRDFEVTVLDQLPVARDERIEVELLSDSTVPTNSDLKDRKGVLAWVRKLAPGASEQLRFGYAVTYPESLELPGF